MPNHQLGYRLSRGLSRDSSEGLSEDLSQGLDGDAMLVEQSRFGDAGEAGTQADRDQLRRDIDAIERATAALRRGAPALKSWTEEPLVVALRKPRPVWLMIGLLWLSTAVVMVGAVAAIAKLVG